ncbi:DUF2613 family protein [Corynebacterium sp. zg254]|uniref:DUF2613 family protein n=1 Tax=Corynebacterium zhongnanshanii TaxID=2768834 RepID=A0ABQ6VCT6_9CORY|nr:MULTISPECIES: DUF2613 domain-containing protein [Corynebacterium]KAB3519970.1 DUF2613 family protein [Corynebacterium zhongnanshanii]MCR5914919.1 DUF2613 family protein [Corynebacterium sp. zg254]
MASKSSTGTAIAGAVAGVILGGAAVLVAGSQADSTSLPSENDIAVSQDSAFLGSVQYGARTN